ncbi:E2F transcription factor E2FE [Trifolium repens]|nr:E2F transcription factor E2FE [Trifolium repens]
MSLGKGNLEMMLQTVALPRTERNCSWMGTSARTLRSKRQWKMIVGCFRMTRSQEQYEINQNYQFGPFASAKVGTSENKVKQVHDWESLATEHCPQYQNQGK